MVAVPQQPEFFEDTILNNLLICPDFSEQEILAALEKVGLQNLLIRAQGVATDLSSNKLGIIWFRNDWHWHEPL